MDPPHAHTCQVNPGVGQHEYLEMVSPTSTIDPREDLPRRANPLPHHGKHASAAQLRHYQELHRGDVPMLEEKIETWRAHRRPRHPIWQYFTHAHSAREQTQSAPHLTMTRSDDKDVECSLCGAHIHQHHTLHKGEVEAIEEIKLARSVLHGMWDHLASQCPQCPENVRHEMRTWHQLPKETLATPAAPVSTNEPRKPRYVVQDEESKARASRSQVVLAEESKTEAGGYEEGSESDDSTSHLLGHSDANAP